MKASWFYRIASVLLLLFAIGHTLGFRQDNPEWGVTAVLALMRSVHFDAQGFNRTYWDFFSAFGLFFSVFLLFAAVLAWLLGGLPAETLARVRSIAWALAICFVAITALSWRYAFTIPIVFSTLITVCRSRLTLPGAQTICGVRKGEANTKTARNNWAWIKNYTGQTDCSPGYSFQPPPSAR